MKECIYCRKNEPEATFTKKEHVIPQSFGKFKDNFTLESVCDECNHSFGKELDSYLAHGTLEGIRRTDFGIETKSNPPRDVSVRMEIQERPYTGLLVKREFSKDTNEFIVNPIPQVCFQKNDGTYDCFGLEEIPEKKNFNDSEGRVFYLGKNFSDIERRLREKGHSITFLGEENIPIGKKPLIEIRAEIDKRTKRALAKIAFNYLAYHNKNHINLIFHEKFDPIRNFVLKGEEPDFKYFGHSKTPIVPDEPDGKAMSGHCIVTEEQGKDVIAKLSLLNHLTYLVKLAKDYPVIGLLKTCGHLFSRGDENTICTLSRHSGLMTRYRPSIIIPYI